VSFLPPPFKNTLILASLCISGLSYGASIEALKLPPLPSRPVLAGQLGLRNTTGQRESLTGETLTLSQATDGSSPEDDDVPASLQIEAVDPKTKQSFHIDVQSENLIYDPQTGIYTGSGETYVIIPEKKMEILAEKIVFNTKTNDMVASGKVSVITDQNVVSSDQAHFDLNKNTSQYQNFKSLTKDYRISAKDTLKTEQYSILKNGRLLINAQNIAAVIQDLPPGGFRLGTGAFYGYFTAQRANLNLRGDAGKVIGEQGQSSAYSLDLTELKKENESAFKAPLLTVPEKPVSPNDVLSADYTNDNTVYKIKVKTARVFRHQDGFDHIVLKPFVFKNKKLPLYASPSTDFGYNETTKMLTYLGPETGYYADYGGFYYGPGFNTRALYGWLKVSPILTYGGGQRLGYSNNAATEVSPSAGLGVLARYRAQKTYADFGYSSTIQEPIALARYNLSHDERFRLRASVNQFYNNGFYGLERPKYSGEVQFRDNHYLNEQWVLRSYASAGVYKDNFFPNRNSKFPALPSQAEPLFTSRIQLQNQLITAKPLFYVSDKASMGLLFQDRVNLYGNGQAFANVQGGPYVNLLLGPLFNQFTYTYGKSFGKSPFVFDRYIGGRSNLYSINALDLSKYITIGATHSLNLNRDNDRDKLVIDKSFFVSIGPKNLRFSMGVNPVQKRSFFGLLINPEGGQLSMDFSTLNVYDPGYTPPGYFDFPGILPRAAKKKAPPKPESSVLPP
jgi:lipopolysaccharide export system protein LptA